MGQPVFPAKTPAGEYLREKEWSMGNGQCPDCTGVHIGWHGHPLYKTSQNIGHKPACKLAAALKDLGEEVLMQGDYKSDIVYESYWDDIGLLRMREKTS